MNPNINDTDFVSKYQSIFDNNGVVVIPNFLTSETAESVYECLLNPPIDPFYYKSISTNNKTVFLVDKSSNHAKINSRRNKAKENIDVTNAVNYSFSRTLTHGDNCTCAYCGVVQNVIKTTAMYDYVETITGKSIKRTEAVFANYMKVDDFLGNHTDSGLGKIGFTLFLTKDWDPLYGGYFSFPTSNHNDIFLTPSFNNLVLYDNGKLHNVTPVKSDAMNSHRYTISGWYQ